MSLVNSRMTTKEIQAEYDKLIIKEAVLKDRLLAFSFGTPCDDDFFTVKDDLFFTQIKIKVARRLLNLR